MLSAIPITEREHRILSQAWSRFTSLSYVLANYLLCLSQLFTFTLDLENHKNFCGSIPEMILENIELIARHGLRTRTPIPRGQISSVLLVEVLTIQTSVPIPIKLSTSFAEFHLPVIINFLNQLASLDLSLCKRFQRFRSLDELPIGLQVMDANNAKSLEWILIGSNWKLSEQLICFAPSKLLKKKPTSNPRKKLLKVSLSISSSLTEVFRP